MKIDRFICVLELNIRPDEYLGHDLQLGRELSDHAEVQTKHRKATLVKSQTDLDGSRF